MKQKRNFIFPLAGQIQHGEQQNTNQKRKVVELGYFISKVNDNNLKFLQNRFNEKYNKQQLIPIRIIDENPLSIKQARYNLGGAVCYCMDGQEEGKQKVSNQWKPIKCLETCPYRIPADENSKPACNEEAILKFLLPDIASDRIWIMRIKGKTSIENLRRYFNLQRELGNSILGEYKLYLTQKEQTKNGKTFHNYILDIIKVDEVNSNNSIPQEQSNAKQISTNSTQNVNNTANKQQESVKQEAQVVEEVIQPQVVEEMESVETDETVKIVEDAKPVEENKKDEDDKKTTTKKTSKKATKAKKEETTKLAETEKEDNKEQQNEYANHYLLIETKTQKILKDGKPTDYCVGNFTDMEDNQIDVFIPHELAEELSECDIGTLVILDLQKAGDKTFTKSIQYVNKYKKNVAA